jgi:hypothetical protein
MLAVHIDNSSPPGVCARLLTKCVQVLFGGYNRVHIRVHLMNSRTCVIKDYLGINDPR